MAKIVLDDDSTNLDPLVFNENFRKIENEFNNRVLYRDNPVGETNEMDDDLDMNSNRIYNLPPPIAEHEAARLKDVQDAVSGANQANLIQFTPYKDITSTSVQGAIQEVKDDIDAGVDDLEERLADTSNLANGAQMIGFRQPLPGSEGKTQRVKGLESVTVDDFSSIPQIADGVIDVTDTVIKAAAAVGSGGIVRFPFAPGRANIYFFGPSFPTSALQDRLIDVDPGVVLSIPDNNAIVGSVAGAEELQFKRATNFYCRDLSRYYEASPFLHKPFLDKMMWLRDSDADRSVTLSLLPTSTSPMKIEWPSSDVWEDDSYSSMDTESFTFTPVLDSFYHVGMHPIKAGEEIRCSIQATAGTPFLVAMIRHENGYVGIYGTSTSPTTEFTFFSKEVGSTGTSSVFTLPMQETHESYHIKDSVLSIRLESWNTFSILLNGFTLLTQTTSGLISWAGFGMYGSGGGQSMTAYALSKTVRADPYGGGVLGIRIFGDSTSVSRYDAWPNFMRDALDFAGGGQRVIAVDNQAVAGYNTTQILQTMQTSSLAGASHIVIAGGTNDIQGQIPLSTSLNNLSAMINLAQGVGAQAIVVIPGLFYTQAQSGPSGQPSVNYELGGPLRAGLIRLCADRGAKVVDPMRFSGPVIANFINPNLSPNYVGEGDPVLYDNIHPTTLSNRITGFTVAKAILGTIHQTNRQVVTTGVPIDNLLGGWTGTTEPPYLNISQSGIVSLAGIINDEGGATKTDGTVVAQIPQTIAPISNIRGLCYSDDAATKPVLIQVDSGGLLRIFGVTTATFIDLSMISWQIVVY